MIMNFLGLRKYDVRLFKFFLLAFSVLIVFAAFIPLNQAEAATNIIMNPSLEQQNADGSPSLWRKGKWGNNDAVFTYPVEGSASARAARVTISNYASGDAKWFFADVAANAGYEYVFGGDYRSDVSTVLTARFQLMNGAYVYKDIKTLPASEGWTSYDASFIAPANATSVTLFHLINKVGFLDIDNQKLDRLPQSTPPPAVPGNIVPNPSFENIDSNGNPVSWSKGKWGTNTAEFIYPVPGNGSNRAAEVKLSNRVSGDAKWYFAEVPVTSGSMYTFSDDYKSDTGSFITAQFTLNNGTKIYQDVVALPASLNWTKTTHAIEVPINAISLTIFHLIKSNGFLAIDNVSLVKKQSQVSTFQNGIVTLSFDDGWKSIYQNAIPILNNAGIKSSQYIITERFDFPAYMNESEVLAVYNAGHEIGSHTETHRDLTIISQVEAKEEIEGSRDTLISLGITPVSTFAYPFGSYNGAIKGMVSNAGYLAARSSDGGLNEKLDADLYALKRIPVDSHTTLAEVTAQIDKAIAEKKWLILNFHRIDTSGLQYSATPQMLQSIVNYIKQKNVETVTLSQGVALTKQ